MQDEQKTPLPTPPVTPVTEVREERSSAKTIATFAAYLMIAMPYNMAMAADWQTPQQVATLSDNATPQGTAITVTTAPIEANTYFQINYSDVAQEVASQLSEQGIEKKATATTNPANSPALYSANHPLKLALHALQVDPATHQWQAQAYIIADGKTEAVKPVAGHYEGVVEVPVLTHQLHNTDVIEASDLTVRDMPSRQLRKDTITDQSQLLGKSPRNSISAERSIRISEISNPVVIKKGDTVDLNYTSPYIHIKTTGTALEDGTQGELIRIKNDKSEKAVSGRVIAAGAVEVNTESGS